jgi:integrase
MHLWQHENGIWYVLYGPRLSRRVSTRTRDRREADAFLAQYVAGASNPIIKEPTVGEILEGYRADRSPHIRGVETLGFNVAALVRHLGDLKPEQLLPAIIRGYEAKRGVAPGTILREIGVLRAALAWAVEHDWIPTARKISSPVKTPRPRDRWLTREEARRLIDACHEPHIRAFVTLGFMSAARSGAILEARWEQVDFDRRLIDYGAGHGNKRRAVVPLNDEVYRALVELRELACTPFVIEYHGKRVLRIRKGFGAACERAGIVDCSPHVMRHSAATWMAMDDIPLREIAKMIGDTEETVERVYAKHSPSYLKRAAGALRLGANDHEGALQSVRQGGQSRTPPSPSV